MFPLVVVKTMTVDPTNKRSLPLMVHLTNKVLGLFFLHLFPKKNPAMRLAGMIRFVLSTFPLVEIYTLMNFRVLFPVNKKSVVLVTMNLLMITMFGSLKDLMKMKAMM
jgi:hypothetical protein